MEHCNILTIIGPTASGKTRLAVDIALEYDGEIISADSRQVYKRMDIGTGKDLSEYSGYDFKIPYHLIDIVEPWEDYNLFQFIKDFDVSFNSIISRNKFPILCGGSGLYVEAALKGYSLPNAPENKTLRENLEHIPKEELISMLQKESMEIFNKTDISSKRRIIRGIEIAKFIKENKTLTTERKNIYKPLIIGIFLPRDIIIKRIDERLHSRLKEGMIEEVESLIKEGVPLEKLYKLGLEYRYSSMYLNSEISYDEMVEKLKIEIHRFSKRQMTWFRGMERRGLKIHWIYDNNKNSAIQIIEKSKYQPI